ncbi:MAG TPA: hypothetical protein VHO69_17390 [Phototrophicaceae bacterium]|nr:hypothetical protein [Phototrophicaceae bacterium]
MAWVEWTTTAQDEDVTWYGYYWWRASDGDDKPYPAFVASGYAGDNIFVYPELDLIVVTKTRWRVSGAVANEQNQVLLRLIYDLIIPAVTDAAE